MYSSSRAVAEPVLGGWPGVVPDVFGFVVFTEAVQAEFTTDAALLVSTPFSLRNVGVEVVDPDRAVP